MKRVTIMSLAMLAGLTAATGAYAEEGCKRPPHPPRPAHARDMFRDADVNRDRKVSQKEFEDFNREVFKEVDANKDGILSVDEWRSHHEKKGRELVEGKP